MKTREALDELKSLGSYETGKTTKKDCKKFK
jgi:hypothetical protein